MLFLSERKIAEKELKKLNRELEHKVIERTKELEKSEKKFRQIFESIPDLFFLVDENTTVIDYRGKREEFFISPEQFLSNKLSEILPSNLGKMTKEYVSITISSKQPQILEYSLPMKGKDQYYEARLLFFTENRVAIFIRNITERKRVEEALREEKNRAQKYLDIAAVMLVIVNAKEEVNLINQKGCEILGYEQKEIVGKNWFDNFIPERDRNEVKSVFQELIAGKVEPVEYFENPILTNNNEERIIAWHNTILNDEKGNIIGTLSSGEDITERKKAEQQIKESEEKLREQNMELRRLDELKNDFITIAAHELKTPMVSITGYTDYILTHYKDLDFEIRKDLLLIQKNSERLNILIEQLLDVMKIDAKKMEITQEEKNIYELIENCVEELSFQIKEKNLNIIMDVQEDLYLRVDPNRIYEVFSNLFSNAVKFTLNGGNIEISAKKIKNQFLFKVRNDGKGLSIRDISKLFKKFEVIEKESADHINRKKGLGLGLYISKGVVEAHGGKIWGTSKGKDKGAEFYFTLPIIEA